MRLNSDCDCDFFLGFDWIRIGILGEGGDEAGRKTGVTTGKIQIFIWFFIFAVPAAIVIYRENKVLKLPRGIDIHWLEDIFKCDAVYDKSCDPYISVYEENF